MSFKTIEKNTFLLSILSGTKFKSTQNSNPTSSTSSSDQTNSNVTSHQQQQNQDNNNEKLDLRDLDLSRLRLTKKDLETLSTLTPTLPKQVQEQLLAQLPPNQARKLCRTLSMQNSTDVNSTGASQKPYKRSLSGGREISDSSSQSNRGSGIYSVDRNSIYRRSSSRSRYDDKPSRSSSRCRDSICDTDESSAKSFLNDISKYRNYKSDYDNNSNSSNTISQSSDYYSSLPPTSSCISPPPLPNDVTMRRRSATSKRISRFLRPDFFDTPREESIYVSKDNKDRDSESRRILKEIRERSRERSADRLGATSSDRLNYIMEKYSKKDDGTANKYSRHSSVDGFNNSRDSLVDFDTRRQSVSKSKDPSYSNIADNINFADKILNELQNITKIQQKREESLPPQSIATAPPSQITSDETDKKIDSKTEKDDQKVVKVKKVKSRDKLAVQNENSIKVNDINMVTNLTKEIDSISPLNVKTKESKLLRPKSYPTKEKSSTKKATEPNGSGVVDQVKPSPTESNDSTTSENNSKTIRPKSYPNSKLTPPKDLKKTDSPPSSTSEKLPVKKVKATAITTTDKTASSSSDKEKTSSEKEKTANGQVKTVKKVIKTVKKSIKSNANVTTPSDVTAEKVDTKEMGINSTTATTTKEPKKDASPPKVKEVSPDKKVNKGFLYSIGQKFEKFRENTKTKEKKITSATTSGNIDTKLVKDNKDTSPGATSTQTPSSTTSSQTASATQPNPNPASISSAENEKKKVKSTIIEELKTKKSSTSMALDKKSKIDTMIRNLREKSVPRSPVYSESRLIKRATSVEDMTTATVGYNKSGVSKVLGIFKKYEKDQLNVSKVKNTQVENDEVVSVTLPRPKSSITENNADPSTKKHAYKGAQSDSILTISEEMAKQQQSKIPKLGCTECNPPENDSVIKRHSTAEAQNLCNEEKEKMKNKRKALMLDFSKLDSNQHTSGVTKPEVETNDTNSNHIPPLINNNCIYPTSISSSNDINRNGHLNPSYDSLINYSSDMRSPYDDAASTSTIFSPNSEEHELMFDNWSVCSDDHTYPSPSPSASHRYSRGSISNINPSPLLENASSESIVDRIRRKSFYTRFNEKKPKRVSTIVGPGATKEYYSHRERDSSVTRPTSAAAVTSSSTITKPPEYKRSYTSSVDHTRNTHEYYRPLKTNTFDNVYNLSSSTPSEIKPKTYHLPPPLHPNKSYDHSSSSDHNTKSSSSDYLSGTYKKTPDIYHHHHHHHHHTPTTSSVLSKRTTMYDPQHLPLPPHSSYSTRSIPSSTSSYMNGVIGSSGSSNIETYATLGRKIRPYEQRSLSLMNSLNMPKIGTTTSGSSSKLGLNSSSGLGIGNSGTSGSSRESSRGTPDYGSLTRLVQIIHFFIYFVFSNDPSYSVCSPRE